MSFKKFVSMNLAIIGGGEVAARYAAGFAIAGHEVFLAQKKGDHERINPALNALENIHLCSIEEAAAIGDLVIIATHPNNVREVAYWLGDVRGKVIIDATSNVHTENDETLKTNCAIKAITGSMHIVKAFNTEGYEQLLKPFFKTGKTQLILVGESKKAKEITKILASELGINYWYDFGTNENLPLFVEMTRCWRNMMGRKEAENRKISFKH